MRGPTASQGQRGTRGSSVFAQAPATSGTWRGHRLGLGRTLPRTRPAMRTCSAQHGHCHLVWLTRAPPPRRHLPPLCEGL